MMRQSMLLSRIRWGCVVNNGGVLRAAKRKLSHNRPHVDEGTSSSYITPRSPGPIPTPTNTQLFRCALISAVPMVGFGFMDNTVMIWIGDALDLSIGVTFGLSTLTAAAFGQIFSDVSGVLFGGTIEQFASRLGIPDPKVLPGQELLRSIRISRTVGSAVGVVVGCLLGMVSLLFKDLHAAERAKRKQQLSTLFKALLDEGSDVVGAQRVSLWLVDDHDKNIVWSSVAKTRNIAPINVGEVFKAYDVYNQGFVSSNELGMALQKMGWVLSKKEIERLIQEAQTGPAKGKGCAVVYADEFEIVIKKILNLTERAVPLRPGGIKHTVVTTGEPVRINDAQFDERFNLNWDKYTGHHTQSLLAVPVKDKDSGEIRGILVAKNKYGGEDGKDIVPFSDGDEAVLKTIASHAAAFINHVERDE